MKPSHPAYPSLVKELRRQLALSQEDLARELGVSYATDNRWENGQAFQACQGTIGCFL
jgi:DNA-binding transcriptional regulator YiaG